MSNTRAELQWHAGVELEPILTKLEAYAARFQLQLAAAPGAPRGEPYVLGWRRHERAILEYSRRPWEMHPLLDSTFRNLTWNFLCRKEILWMGCGIYSWPEERMSCVEGAKLGRLLINFDEEPNSWSLDSEAADRAVRKYSQIREIYAVLDCDEINGYSDSHYSAGTTFDQDPEHLQKIFRFAKSGRNILIIPMEEGRARRIGEQEWRRIVDV